MLFKRRKRCCTSVVFIRETNNVVQANLGKMLAQSMKDLRFSTNNYDQDKNNISHGGHHLAMMLVGMDVSRRMVPGVGS